MSNVAKASMWRKKLTKSIWRKLSFYMITSGRWTLSENIFTTALHCILNWYRLQNKNSSSEEKFWSTFTLFHQFVVKSVMKSVGDINVKRSTTKIDLNSVWILVNFRFYDMSKMMRWTRNVNLFFHKTFFSL